jgi:carbonic anhydrase
MKDIVIHDFMYVLMFLIQVQLDLPSNVKIQGGKLAGPYKALQLHFHWGKDGGPGSEHTIDGERFPMEVTKINQSRFTLKCIALGYKDNFCIW